MHDRVDTVHGESQSKRWRNMSVFVKDGEVELILLRDDFYQSGS